MQGADGPTISVGPANSVISVGPSRAPLIDMMPVVCRIYSEPYAGLQAQAIGLAEAAGWASDMHILRAPTPWNRFPARFWPNPLRVAGVANLDLDYRSPARSSLSDAEVAISVGGLGAAVGAALRRSGRCVIQVQAPRMDLRRFDLIVAARHDELSGPNVIIARTALHRATLQRLAEARALWLPRLAFLPRPLVAVLVGGSNGRFRLEAAEGAALATSLAALLGPNGPGLAVTPSRRTAPAVRLALETTLRPRGAWVWDLTGENPYFGLLACADIIIATIDSVSMISEAVATSAPVLLAELPGRSHRIGRFLRGLKEDGRVRTFQGRLEHWPVTPLDDTAWAAEEMRRRLGV